MPGNSVTCSNKEQWLPCSLTWEAQCGQQEVTLQLCEIQVKVLWFFKMFKMFQRESAEVPFNIQGFSSPQLLSFLATLSFLVPSHFLSFFFLPFFSLPFLES